MNLVLLSCEPQQKIWKIEEPRQVQHLKTHLKTQVGDTLKVGIKNGKRYVTRVVEVTESYVCVEPLVQESIPKKLPITLIVALPRPKVLRRLIMDSVTIGVQKIVLIHSYRVDKSYWQSPYLRQINDYITLGLEQAGDTIFPEVQLFKRFKPFVEDILAPSIQVDYPTFLAHPYTDIKLSQVRQTPCQIVIGPEGGFIPYEVDLLVENGCQAVNLGSRILRTETVISYVLGQLALI